MARNLRSREKVTKLKSYENDSKGSEKQRKKKIDSRMFGALGKSRCVQGNWQKEVKEVD